jgi:YHS domain-containing protein
VKCIFGLISVIFAVTIVTACAATPGKVSQIKAVESLNLLHGVALKGYDPVAYFAEEAPAVGDPAISYQWRGATWVFSTAAHREAFVADPAHYAPQYGGYCAFAVSRGTTADADPGQWAIVEGKLYVNNNAFAKKLWNQDRPANIEAGDLNWPLIPKLPVDSSPASAVGGSAPAASSGASGPAP